MSNKTLTVDVGTTVAEAEKNASAFAGALYDAIPTDFAPGQTFKNAFVKSFLNRANRARRMAGEIFGIGSRKAVKNEVLEYEEEEEFYDDDHECCHHS